MASSDRPAIERRERTDAQQEAERATFGRTTDGLPAITTSDKDTTTRAHGETDERVGTDRCFTCKRRRSAGEVLDCERRGAGRVGCSKEGASE